MTKERRKPLWGKANKNVNNIHVNMSTRLSPFVTAYVHSYPSCFCTPTDTLCTCSCLCTCLYPIFSFAPAHELHNFFSSTSMCLHTYLWPYCTISSLHVLCQYPDQSAHYPKYHDQFLTFAAFTTEVIYARQSRGSNSMF